MNSSEQSLLGYCAPRQGGATSLATPSLLTSASLQREIVQEPSGDAIDSREHSNQVEVLNRLWETNHYDLVGEGKFGPGVAVSSLSFYDDSSTNVIAVDKEGSVCLFVFAASSGTRNVPDALNNPCTPLHEIDADAQNRGYSDLLSHQFSANGRVLAQFRTIKYRGTEKYNFITASIHKLDHGASPQRFDVQSVFDASSFNVPLLSKNGKSLVVCCFQKEDEALLDVEEGARHETHIRVVPDLETADQQFVEINGQHALWGQDGEWLLVWDQLEKRPLLSIYKTQDIRLHGRLAQPIARRTLDLGLFSWTAGVIDYDSREDSLIVLICEIVEVDLKKLRRFLIWDTKKNAVLKEVRMNMYQHSDLGQRRCNSFTRPIDQAVECRMPPTTYDAYYLCVVRDLFPDFCISRDGNWVGALSRQHHGAGISSFMTGVTTWNFRLQDDFKLDPFRTPYRASFDPMQRHFVIFGDDRILAYRPFFLCSAGTAPIQKKKIGHSWDLSSLEIAEETSAKAWHVLPSAALAKKRMTKIEAKPCSWPSLRQLKSQHINTILDASQSADGSFSASLALVSNEEKPIAVYVSRNDCELPTNPFPGLQFPKCVQGIEEEFVPARVIVFEDGTSIDKKSLVLFSIGQTAAAVFCSIESEEVDGVEFQMDSCLDVSLSEDRSKVAMLDVCGVCILNLSTRKIEATVLYQVNFRELLQMTHALSSWSRKGREERGCHFGRRISDDGQSVLLAWDVMNRKSLVVKPKTTERECQKAIHDAAGNLSEFCVLTASGTSTTFLDVDNLEHGKITIGIFNETVQKAALDFHVAENMPRHLKESVKLEILSSVFYGVSEEGNELVTATIGFRQISVHRNPVEDMIGVFSIYGAGDCIPTYDQLTLKRFPSMERTFKKLYDDHGVSAFNEPSSDGMSIFQKAFLTGNKEMVDAIKDLAVGHECLLAVEWISPSCSRMCNLLKTALMTMSSPRIKEAVEIVNSKVVPFGNAARIMKESFKDLIANDLTVVEYALAKNLFVTHVCDFDVHAKFMDPKRRRDVGDHINTTDTFLDWSHIENKNALTEKWREKNRAVVEKMEVHGDFSTTRASLKFIRIEDAAKTGMNGIIRPLLLQKVPERFFGFDVIRWIVMFKWLKIWRRKFLRNAAWYAAFLAFFTAYAVYLSRTPQISKQSHVDKVWLSFFLAVAFVFSGHVALEEARQLRTYMKDGIKHAETRARKGRDAEIGRMGGLLFYLRFKWNWIDLVSCALMMIFIAPLHLVSLRHPGAEDALSAFVAIECIVLYAKVWYYAQPFQVSGPLVQMIGNIVSDSWKFLALAFVIMIGYGVALPVLFRQVEVPRNTCAIGSQETTNVSAVIDCGHVAVRPELLASEVFRIEGERCLVSVANEDTSGMTYCGNVTIATNTTADAHTSLDVFGEDCIVLNSRTDLQDTMICDDVAAVEPDSANNEMVLVDTIIGGNCTAEEDAKTMLGMTNCGSISVLTECMDCNFSKIEVLGEDCTTSERTPAFMPLVDCEKGRDTQNLDYHRYPHRSLLTLFYALVGNFDPKLYLAVGDLSWLTSIIFVTYLLAQLIVLLNLLISLMGDTFDRVKRTEEAQLLMGRAQFIDACEAALTEAQCAKIDDEVGRYLHVLMNVHEESDDNLSAWIGKLGKIERDNREVTRKSEESIINTMQNQFSQHFSKMSDQMNDLQSQLDDYIRKTQSPRDRSKEKQSPESSAAVTGDAFRRASERMQEILEHIKGKQRHD